MKTLFHPFFSRSASSDGQAQEKMPGRQRTTRRRGGPDKSAQSQPAATTQRGTAFSSQQPHNKPPKPQTHMQTQTPDATTEQPYPGLFDRIIRRRTTSREGAANRGAGGSRKNRMDATVRSQLTAVPDEGPSREASCSEVAPLGHHEGDDMNAVAASSSGPKTQRRFSRLQKPSNTNTMSTQGAASQPAKLRPRSSFRDRFWTVSPANDFGGVNSEQPLTSPKSPTFKLSHDASIPEEEPAPTKPKAYVPRHAAADFSRTTMSSSYHRHRPSASWDGSRNGKRVPPMPVLQQPTPRTMPQPAPQPMPQPAVNPPTNYVLDSRPVAEAEAIEDPFADSNEAADLSEMDALRRKRLSAPPAVHRDSVADNEWPPSDYERFLEHARADERAQRIQAARRSWREGSKRDSAYYSGKKGSARTSEDGSRRLSGSGRESAVPPMPAPVTLSGNAMADAKRQSRVAQKIVEYIKPSREDAKMTALREA